ncbi:MAG: choice-of-anchor tandem repeat GloVer-containing protein [Candidatus Sulfotelmatobacter sp.]
MRLRRAGSGLIRRILATFSVVFVLVGASWAGSTLKVLYSFKGGTDGSFPSYQLLIDPAGNLYGITLDGGSTTDCYGSGCGTVFQLMPRDGRWAETVLYSIPASTSPYPDPNGPLVRDGSGSLFGVIAYGGDPVCQCGEIYELTRSAGVWTETDIHNFVGGNSDGQYLNPGLVRDSAGNFYGSTGEGGNGENCNSECGTIFEFTPNSDGSWTENLIYNFTGGRDGENPGGPMTIDAEGNLYGITTSGGVYGYGTAYKLALSNGAWAETTLFDFTIDASGGSVSQISGIAVDSFGDLFAVAPYGGGNQVGIVYELTPTAGYSKCLALHTFTGAGDGGEPFGGLSIDKAGNLYGTTIYGGTYEYGTVYRLAPGKGGRWSETVLHSFSNGNDGSYPYGVILDSSGNLYGTAIEGGANGYGVAYELTQ